MTNRERAKTPEDITRLFVERSNAGDADGVAELYAEDAVLAFPPGSQPDGTWLRIIDQPELNPTS